jgi:hypothetical protein
MARFILEILCGEGRITTTTGKLSAPHDIE